MMGGPNTPTPRSGLPLLRVYEADNMATRPPAFLGSEATLSRVLVAHSNPGHISPMTCYHPWGRGNTFHLGNLHRLLLYIQWLSFIPYQHTLPGKTPAPSTVQAGPWAEGSAAICGSLLLAMHVHCAPQMRLLLE